MSAMAHAKRWPRFSTYTEVDVDIEPEDLQRAGWVYVGDDTEGEASTERVIDVVHRWHDDHHDGPWRWCQHELCDELRGREKS